jgi:hypothetical protein
MSKRIHVVPHGRGWATRREGAFDVESRHRTQSTAQEHARAAARREGGEVIVHRPDGRIRDADSYGSDPFPPRG